MLIAIVATLIAVAAYCWIDDGDDVDAHTGLWFLPNGGFWTAREKDTALWVEETHHDSQQVWKRGPGRIDNDGLHAALQLVCDKQSFRYLHELQLAADGQSLIGGVRRSDRSKGRSLVLTRIRP